MFQEPCADTAPVFAHVHEQEVEQRSLHHTVATHSPTVGR